MSDSRIHIVHIIPSLSFGGAERFVVNLINASDPAQFRFTVITFFDLNPLAQELTHPDCVVEVIHKRGAVSWSLFGRIKKRLRELSPHVVHTHLFGGDVWGRVAAHSLRIPIVTTEHSFNIREGYIKELARLWLKNYSTVYTVPSQALKDFLEKRVGITKPIILIRHGIVLERFNFTPALFTTSTLRFCIIGRLVPEKGHSVVVRALAKLQSLPWTLEIVGDGPEKVQLKSLIKRLHIQDRVILSGPSLDVAQKLKSNDIILVPSTEPEGLGIVVLEAMAAGRVVIGSKVAGISELISEGRTGLLLEAGDKEAWIHGLKWCFYYKDELATIAQQAQQYAQEEFSSKKMMEKYKEIYLSLAKK